MKTYWYAAGLKGGGVMVFSAPRKYTKISARQLRTRFTWLSKPYASQRDAAVFLGQKVGFRNPPQKITVLHQGKITVQHLSDPKRKSNPKQQTIMTRSQGLTYLMQRYSITKKEAADTWDYVVKPGMHDENIRMTADNVARQCDKLDKHKNPARTLQPKTFPRWQATCRRIYGNIVTFFREAGKTYGMYHGKIIGFWDESSHRSVVYTKSNSNPKNHLGENEYYTYGGWKAAIKKKYPSAKFRGNKELGSAYIVNDASTSRWPMQDVGEWEGDKGTVIPHIKEKNPPQFMEMMFQKWKQQCRQRHPNSNVQGNAYGAKCFNQEGDRMGVWNGEDGWVA